MDDAESRQMSVPANPQLLRAVRWSRRVRMQLGKRNKFNGREFFQGEKGRAFDVTRSAKAGADAGEVGVVVAGMGDELPCAGRQTLEQGTQGGSVEDAGAGHGDGAAGGDKSFLVKNPAANRLQPAQGAHLRQPHPRRAMRGTARPFRLEGVADRMDSASTRGAKDGAQNCRKDMRMLVRVNVSQPNASLLEED